MIKVYSGFKGFAATLFFIAGGVLFLSIVLWGVSKAIELLLPLLIVFSYLLIVVFVFVFLPAGFFSKNLRPSIAVYSSWMSHGLGVFTWMVSFFFVINSFGWGGVFLILLFQLLGPVALVVAILRDSWHVAMHLAVWISFIYGMRFYSHWLLNLNAPREEIKADIIDVGVVEIEDEEKGTH